MTLKMQRILKSLTKLNLLSISFVLAYFAALIYPHKAMGGGVFLAAKTVIELLLISAFVLFLTAKRVLEAPVLEQTSLTRPIFALTILLIFAATFAQNRPIALEALLLYLAYCSCFYIFLSLLQEGRQQVILATCIIIIAVALCLFGLYRHALFNARFDEVWRLQSTFGNSNQMAGFLAMTIPLYVGYLFSKSFSGVIVFINLSVLLLMISTLFFTYGRGAWIATTIAICFILSVQTIVIKANSKRIMPILLTLFIGGGAVFISNADLVNRFNTMTQEDTEVAISGRTLAWEGTIEMIKKNPLSGVGPGNYSKAFRAFQPPGLSGQYMYAHNDYLHFVSETGVILIPIMIWLLSCLFKHGMKKVQLADQQLSGVTLGAMGGIIAMLVHCVTDFNLHNPANALLFILLTTLVVSPGGKIRSYCLSGNAKEYAL